MIHKPRGGDRNRYWDDPVNRIAPSEANLRFVDYFDWDRMNYSDLRYYQVQIEAFPSKPHLVGRDALIEHGCAKVMTAEP